MTAVAFLVTHLAGSGHLVRTLALARAVQAAGAEATVISGGRPLPHLDAEGVAVRQLPPLSVRGLDYATLLGPDGAPATEELLAERREAICAAIAERRPKVLVTETYPLGRRKLAAEFGAAVAVAEAEGARLVASVRDVPEPPKNATRLAEAAARLAPYAAVLVHGEAELLPLSESWPLPAPAAAKIRHTGYVGPPEDARPDRGEVVLVSVVAESIESTLHDTAAAAAGQGARARHLLVGGADAAAAADRLAAGGGPVTAEPVRSDYRALLAGAAASVSLAGYNTVMDLAACRTPAVLVPMADAGEREQTIRAARLARLPGVAVLTAAGLTAARLAEAAEAAARGPRRPPWPWPRDGAARAAAALLEIAA